MTGALAVTTLALMAGVTYMTRIGGYLAINRLSVTPRLNRALEATTGSALVAIVAPAAADGDVASQVALFSAAVVMVVTRRPLPAVAIGAIVAATVRAV